MGVFAGNGAQDAVGGGNGVTAALDRELDDVLGIEVIRVFGEAGATGMFDALINGEDGDVTGAGTNSGRNSSGEVRKKAFVTVKAGPLIGLMTATDLTDAKTALAASGRLPDGSRGGTTVNNTTIVSTGQDVIEPMLLKALAQARLDGVLSADPGEGNGN